MGISCMILLRYMALHYFTSVISHIYWYIQELTSYKVTLHEFKDSHQALRNKKGQSRDFGSEWS